MSKIYLVKNTWETAKSSSKWIQMDGFSFYKFIKSPEASDRYFIKLPPLLKDGNDNFITIEASKKEYRKWRSEMRHKRHLREYGTAEKKYTVISYHAIKSEDSCYGEESLPDESINIEEEIEKLMEREALTDTLIKLTAEERWLIDELYLFDNTKSVHKLSKECGIPRMTLNDRKKRILIKLKKFL